MDTDSFYLARSDESLGGIVKPGMRQAYEADKFFFLQQTNLAREHPAYLSLNLLVQEVCGLPLSAILFKIKIRFRKVNIAVKVFQRNNDLYFVRYKDVLDVRGKNRQRIRRERLWQK